MPDFDSTYEERVAIMIADGGLSEGEAKQKSWLICYKRMEMTNTPDGGVSFKHTLTAPKPPKPAPLPPAAEQTEMSFEEFRAQARQRGW